MLFHKYDVHVMSYEAAQSVIIGRKGNSSIEVGPDKSSG